MASGTLRNLAESAFVRTPPTVTIRTLRNLLAQQTPDGVVMLLDALAGAGYPITVLDPTCGQGDLLEPLKDYAKAQLFGVEISAERADESRRRMPRAHIVTSALEATRITLGSLSMVLTNPAYMVSNGQRVEYAVLREAGKALQAGGIMVAVLPARQWDGHLVNHWARNYTDIRAWRFESGDPDEVEESFERFTQMVVIGVRRAEELEKPDPGIKAAIAGWRWRIPDDPADSPWAGGVDLPVVPTTPIADPYIVPVGTVAPEIKVVKADNSQLLLALPSTGAHLSPLWQKATEWRPNARVEAPVMPPTGTAHLAADILTGLLDGDVVTGPDGKGYIFNTFVTSEMAPVEVDEDAKAKGTVRIIQQQDKAVLTVLSLETGDITTHQGVDAFAFLKPWLPTLAAQVLAKRKPIYNLDAHDWEIRVTAEIGLDKALPGAEFPGLAAPQIHRSVGMLRALELTGSVAIQGEMGTGKTRMLTALAALFAERWKMRPEMRQRALQPHNDRIAACKAELTARLDRDPVADVSDLRATLRVLRAARQEVDDAFAGHTGKAPAWIKKLQSAWRNNPHLKRLGIRADRLKALPIAVTPPKRVTSVWEYEIALAYVGAESIVIESHHDVRRWLRRCTETDAPAVVAIFPQSLTRPGRVVWKPAVLQKAQETESLVTEQAKAERAQWDAAADRWTFPEPGKGGTYDPSLPVRELIEVKLRDKVVGYTDKLTGRHITEWLVTPHFYCPDCGKLVEGEPHGKAKATREADDTEATEAAEEERLEPVTSMTYFVRQQRTCRHCAAPLWTRVWTPATEAKAGMPTFDVWGAAADQLSEQDRVRQAIADTDKAKKRRKARNPQRITTCPVERPEEQFEAEVTRYNAKDQAWDELTVGVTLSDPIEDSFSPYEYLFRFFAGCVALAIVDESHNARGKATDIAAAIHQLQRASQAYVYASGTHYGGAISDFFFYWFRFDPGFWKRLGIGWDEVEKAMSLYGVVQEVTKEHVSEARKGSGQSDTTVSTMPAPGISARLLPHLLSKMVFIGVLDVGAFMPPREEIPVIIDMDDPELELRIEDSRAAHQAAKDALAAAQQDEREVCEDPTATMAELNAAAESVREAREAVEQADLAAKEAVQYKQDRDLKGKYKYVEGSLQDLAEKRNQAATLAKGTLPRLWAVQPFGPKIDVTSTRRSDWGDIIGTETVFSTPRLSADHIYPGERKLQSLVDAERAEGRVVMVYFFQNDERPMAPRICQVLAAHNPWVLPNNVDPEDREEAIKGAIASGRSVVVVPYTRVIEGLNLQVVDTIIWWEMAMNLFHLGQADRRAWRLGKVGTVRLYYMAYRGTVAHKKLHKLGSQSGAASLFAGDTPDGALAKSTGADKTTLAQLSSGIEDSEEELLAAFDRRGKELAAALKKGREWIGVTDTLPERLRAYHVARVARAAAAPTITVTPADVVTAPVFAEEVAPEVAAVLDAEPEVVLVEADATTAKPVVQFGDIEAIGSVLRSRRKARRAATPAAADMGQVDMLTDLFGAIAPEPAAPARKRGKAAPADAMQQASMGF